jgi:hypothetical protein
LFPLEESDESTTSVVQTIVLLWVASPSTVPQAGMAAFTAFVTSPQASDAWYSVHKTPSSHYCWWWVFPAVNSSPAGVSRQVAPPASVVGSPTAVPVQLVSSKIVVVRVLATVRSTVGRAATTFVV